MKSKSVKREGGKAEPKVRSAQKRLSSDATKPVTSGTAGTIRRWVETLGRLSASASGGLGGTASLAGLGGNLPPSLWRSQSGPVGSCLSHKTCRLVACMDGQVVRSTRPIEAALCTVIS